MVLVRLVKGLRFFSLLRQVSEFRVFKGCLNQDSNRFFMVSLDHFREYIWHLVSREKSQNMPEDKISTPLSMVGSNSVAKQSNLNFGVTSFENFSSDGNLFYKLSTLSRDFFVISNSLPRHLLFSKSQCRSFVLKIRRVFNHYFYGLFLHL